MPMHQVEYLQISVFPEGHSCLVLRWAEKKRILPIWIGFEQAAKQRRREEQSPPRRPRLNDLFIDAVSRFGSGFKEMHITSYYEGDFIAVLVTNNGEEFDCRPSDAISVAYSLDLPILVDESVLSQASVYVSEADLKQWLGLDFGDDITQTFIEDSASGDAAADADFSRMMESMGVSEADLMGDAPPEK